MDFGTALSLCKEGNKISRTGWNGAGQYVAYWEGHPDGVKIVSPATEVLGLPVGTLCKFAPYLLMKNAQDVFVPWLASQGDLLAEDWVVVPE